MKILMAAAECVPFVKTGGLADVVGSLPKELVKDGAQVAVVLPLYRDVPQAYRERMAHVCYFYVNLGWRHQYCGIERLDMDGVTYYFIDNQYYFDRPYVYGLGGDEGERYAFFCRAILEMMPQVDYIPDVLHLHDWHPGMAAMLLRTQYGKLSAYQNIKVIFTIHNLAYQGIFPIATIEDLLSLGDQAYLEGGAEFYGQCSFMKAALNFSDRITTVSKSYAEEIQTAYYGEHMDGILRARADKLTGIINGIDEQRYDPETDPHIDLNYNWRSLGRKAKNKAKLQAELGLNVSEETPLIGMVGRLSGQKGLDLVECVLEGIIATGAQLVVLGKGEDKYVDMLKWAQWKYQGSVAACVEMNEPLAHKIYASSDLFLMPSKFEPCGLSQLISLRYGTLPIVRETGGLRDTVLSYNEYTGEGNGFTFLNYNAHDMLSVVQRAVGMYMEDNKTFSHLARCALRGKYGWDQSADKYMELYNDVTGVGPVAEGEVESAEVDE